MNYRASSRDSWPAKAIDGITLLDLIGSVHLTLSLIGNCPERITGSGWRVVALKTQFSTKDRTSPLE